MASSAEHKSFFYLRVISFLLVLFYLTGCASLPEVDIKLINERTDKSIQLANSKGVLSLVRSAEFINSLKNSSGAKDILEKHLALEEAIVGHPLTTGNKVVLLKDGPETYASMFEALENAKHHINLETYIFDNDEIGQKFAETLHQKQLQGVQVNIIYDSVGALNTPKEFFDNLTSSGIKVLEFNPVNPLNAKRGWLINQRDHRKLMIVDGEIAFIGGINISGVYSKGSSSINRSKNKGNIPWRDTHIRVEGPAVKDFQTYFLDTWQRQDDEALPDNQFFPPLKDEGTAAVRAIGSSAGEKYNPIYITLISAIKTAESQIHLTNAYFVPDPQLMDALKTAAQRGVDVKLLLPGQTDFWAVFHAGRSHYKELLKAGVKIYERQGALLHSKTVIIDNVWSSVGSTNLDWRSFVHNDELNGVILDYDFAQQMQTMFDNDIKKSKQIVLEKWESRPLFWRVKEWTARLWEYWL